MKKDATNTVRKDGLIKRPIRRTLILVSVLIIFVLSGLITSVLYSFISSLGWSENSERLTDITVYVESRIDADDLKACRDSGVKSAKYVELQAFLNHFIDRFDVAYLYIVVPEKRGLVNVISATSQAERDAGEDDLYLGEVSDAYPDDVLREYIDAYGKKEISFFEETSDWGTYFTACKTLFDSNGEKVALICADRDIEAMRRLTTVMMIVVAAVAFGTTLLFALVAGLLIRKNITGPIIALEKTTRDFANDVKNDVDVTETQYVLPSINTGNEVQSLAEAIEDMAISLKESAQRAIEAAHRIHEKEKENALLAEKAESADIDALTGVKNKHAYIDLEGQINQTIEDGAAEPFAVAIFDINDLKLVNDTQGHVAGDEYICAAREMICDAFDHVPVFRVGGDEFAVIVQGDDYDRIDESMRKVADANRRNSAAGKVTVACGMARYEGDVDVSSVFKRADARMYEHKRKIKKR